MKLVDGYFQIANPARQSNPVTRFLKSDWVRTVCGGAPLPERRYVELFLKAVNQGELSADDWLSIQSGAQFVSPGGKLTPPADLVKHWRESLANVVRDPKRIGRTLGPFMLDHLAGRVVAVPVVDKTSNSTELTFRIMGTDQYVGLDYGELLLVTKYASELCRCKLESCGKFFLVQPIAKGRPRREYCSDAHREEFFNLGAAARVKKARDKAKLAAARELVRRHR